MTGTSLRYHSTEYIYPPHGFCPGCSVVLALRYFLKVMGHRIVLVMPPGCASPSVIRPQRSLRHQGEPIDILPCPFGSTAFISAGVKSSLVARNDRETQVVGWAGDGATFDIGFGAVSAAAERNDDIIYVCYDNEAYMNTGNQRSSATMWGAKTATNPPPDKKNEYKKDIMWIMMGHDIPYAATATVAYPDDLMMKVLKAKSMSGFRFLHILTPCVPGWGFKPDLTIRVSKLAVQTRLFPLYECEPGPVITINKDPKPRHINEYVQLQERFRHLTVEDKERLARAVEQRWERLRYLAGYGQRIRSSEEAYEKQGR